MAKSKNYSGKMNKKEFDSWAEDYLSNKENIVQRPVVKKKSSTVTGRPNLSKKGWYHEPYRHSMAARGIKTAMGGEVQTMQRTKRKPPSDIQGDLPYYEPPEENVLKDAYLMELDEMRKNNDEKFLDVSPDLDEEHERRASIIDLAESHIVTHNMSDDELSDFMRKAKSAYKGDNELQFYWEVGEVVEE